MSLIATAAHVRTCPHCHVYSIIVFADGFESKGFITVEDGLRTIDKGLSYGRLTSREEFLAVVEQVKAAHLFERDSLPSYFEEDLLDIVEAHPSLDSGTSCDH